jgi:NAD-dependent deacetylase
LHLHGELLKVKYNKSNYILDWKDDLVFGDLDNQQNQLRPHIVWFGEEVLN